MGWSEKIGPYFRNKGRQHERKCTLYPAGSGTKWFFANRVREIFVNYFCLSYETCEGLFLKTGLRPDTFPVDFYASYPHLTLQSAFQPSVHAMLTWHKLVKEWVGIIVYELVGYI